MASGRVTAGTTQPRTTEHVRTQHTHSRRSRDAAKQYSGVNNIEEERVPKSTRAPGMGESSRAARYSVHHNDSSKAHRSSSINRRESSHSRQRTDEHRQDRRERSHSRQRTDEHRQDRRERSHSRHRTDEHRQDRREYRERGRSEDRSQYPSRSRSKQRVRQPLDERLEHSKQKTRYTKQEEMIRKLAENSPAHAKDLQDRKHFTRKLQNLYVEDMPQSAKELEREVYDLYYRDDIPYDAAANLLKALLPTNKIAARMGGYVGLNTGRDLTYNEILSEVDRLGKLTSNRAGHYKALLQGLSTPELRQLYNFGMYYLENHVKPIRQYTDFIYQYFENIIANKGSHYDTNNYIQDKWESYLNKKGNSDEAPLAKHLLNVNNHQLNEGVTEAQLVDFVDELISSGDEDALKAVEQLGATPKYESSPELTRFLDFVNRQQYSAQRRDVEESKNIQSYEKQNYQLQKCLHKFNALKDILSTATDQVRDRQKKNYLQNELGKFSTQVNSIEKQRSKLAETAQPSDPNVGTELRTMTSKLTHSLCNLLQDFSLSEGGRLIYSLDKLKSLSKNFENQKGNKTPPELDKIASNFAMLAQNKNITVDCDPPIPRNLRTETTSIVRDISQSRLLVNSKQLQNLSLESQSAIEKHNTILTQLTEKALYTETPINILKSELLASEENVFQILHNYAVRDGKKPVFYGDVKNIEDYKQYLNWRVFKRDGRTNFENDLNLTDDISQLTELNYDQVNSLLSEASFYYPYSTCSVSDAKNPDQEIEIVAQQIAMQANILKELGRMDPQRAEDLKSLIDYHATQEGGMDYNKINKLHTALNLAIQACKTNISNEDRRIVNYVAKATAAYMDNGSLSPFAAKLFRDLNTLEAEEKLPPIVNRAIQDKCQKILNTTRNWSGSRNIDQQMEEIVFDYLHGIGALESMMDDKFIHYKYENNKFPVIDEIMKNRLLIDTKYDINDALSSFTERVKKGVVKVEPHLTDAIKMRLAGTDTTNRDEIYDLVKALYLFSATLGIQRDMDDTLTDDDMLDYLYNDNNRLDYQKLLNTTVKILDDVEDAYDITRDQLPDANNGANRSAGWTINLLEKDLLKFCEKHGFNKDPFDLIDSVRFASVVGSIQDKRSLDQTAEDKINLLKDILRLNQVYQEYKHKIPEKKKDEKNDYEQSVMYLNKMALDMIEFLDNGKMTSAEFDNARILQSGSVSRLSSDIIESCYDDLTVAFTQDAQKDEKKIAMQIIKDEYQTDKIKDRSERNQKLTQAVEILLKNFHAKYPKLTDMMHIARLNTVAHYENQRLMTELLEVYADLVKLMRFDVREVNDPGQFSPDHKKKVLEHQADLESAFEKLLLGEWPDETLDVLQSRTTMLAEMDQTTPNTMQYR